MGEVVEERLVLGGVGRAPRVAHERDVAEDVPPVLEGRHHQAGDALQVRPVLRLHLAVDRLEGQPRDAQGAPALEHPRRHPLVGALGRLLDHPAAQGRPLRVRVIDRDGHEPALVRRDHADEGAVADELGEPPRDGVEGGLVVEAGGEDAGGLGQRLQARRLPPQRLLGPVLLGEVEAGGDDDPHAAALVEEGGVGPGDEAGRAVLGDPVVLVLVREVPGDEPREDPLDLRPLVLWNEEPERPADHLVALVAGDRLAGGVPSLDPRVAVDDDHERTDGLDDDLREVVVLHRHRGAPRPSTQSRCRR